MRGLAFAAAILVVVAGSAWGADYLTGKDLETAFRGKTVSMSDGTRIYYGADGRFTERRMDGKTPRHRRSGQWWGDKAGLLCRKYPAGTLECARARLAGKRVTFVTVFGKVLGEAEIEAGRQLPGD